MSRAPTSIVAAAFWAGAHVCACTSILGIAGDYRDQEPAADASAAGAAGNAAGGSSGASGSAGAAGTPAGGAAGAGGVGGFAGAPQDIALVNADFEANQEKTWFWDWDGQKGSGALVPGAIPGWTTDEDPGIGGPGKGDSGVEPGGNPGMRLFLNSTDWDVYQTSGYAIQTGDAFELRWDQLDTYSPTAGGMLVVVATLFYFDGNKRVVIDSATSTEPQSDTWAPHSLGVDAVPAQAVGKPVGVAFDNTTTDGESWIGIDNVALTVRH